MRLRFFVLTINSWGVQLQALSWSCHSVIILMSFLVTYQRYTDQKKVFLQNSDFLPNYSNEYGKTLINSL